MKQSHRTAGIENEALGWLAATTDGQSAASALDGCIIAEEAEEKKKKKPCLCFLVFLGAYLGVYRLILIGAVFIKNCE